MADLTLTPAAALIIFVLTCIAGYQYRRVWKADGPHWQLWVFGLAAAIGLLTVGLIPLDIT